MKKFKLYVIHKEHKTLVTSFDNSNPSYINTTNTYDEQLSEAENDQFTLTFSMPRYLAVDVKNSKFVYNYWLDIIKMGSRLELLIDDNRRIDFIISAVAPALSRSNIVYNFTAQDEVSYLWSRHNLGYSYPGTDEEDDGPQCMAEFATRILRDNHLDHTGSVMWTPGPVVRDKFSFSIENSNPYNAMVEAANVLGYNFHINYNTHTISFYLSESEENKFSGYRYRPETNLKSFSASYDATQLCTIMHAVGGTDAQEQIIPLTPALPHAFKQGFTKNSDWRDSDYEKGIQKPMTDISSQPYTDILNKIIESESTCNINTKNYKVISADGVTSDDITDGSIYQYFRGVIIPAEQYASGGKTKEERKPHADLFAIEQLQAEVDECVEFVQIANRVPYLGQFLCDFSFFDENHSGLLTSAAQIGIYEILDKMRVNNTILKIHTPAYYNILYTIAKKHAEMETLAEQYQAEWRIIADKLFGKSESSDITENLSFAQTVCNKLTSLFSDSYFNLFFKAYGQDYTAPKLTDQKLKFYNYGTTSDLADLNNTNEGLILISDYFRKIYPEWQTGISNLENAEKQYQIHQAKYWSIKAKSNPNDKDSPEQIMLESELESEDNYIKTYDTLRSAGTIQYQDKTGENSITVPGKWSMLIAILYRALGDRMKNIDQQGLSTTIKQAEDNNAQETARLYANYGDFIYETTYENTDELDSIGLYNQTFKNFTLYNKPAASYSMTTIDLNCLEQISIPNVVVGAKIRVYNELLNLKDGENNNLQYTNNDLTITAISRKLRSSDDVSFTVEKTNRINKLVEKLLINL